MSPAIRWLASISATALASNRSTSAATRRPRASAESFGVLVNYLYDPAMLDDNHDAYVNEGAVAHSPEIAAALED